MTTLDTEHTIEPGDFIRSALIHWVCGIVLRTGTVGGSLRIPGFWIELGNGREDFIDTGSAELLHKSPEWWALREAEVQAGILVFVEPEA